jgi:hypothetical protein
MASATGLPDFAEPLYRELVDMVLDHNPRPDSFYYNGGTVFALLATGAATVLAGFAPLGAAIASSIASFIIALSRALNFGGRWRWHLQQQNDYSRLIYELNAVALLEAPDEQRAAVRTVYRRLIALKASDAGIPGSGEPVLPQGDDDRSERQVPVGGVGGQQ